jgi:hypothetical protein
MGLQNVHLHVSVKKRCSSSLNAAPNCQRSINPEQRAGRRDDSRGSACPRSTRGARVVLRVSTLRSGCTASIFGSDDTCTGAAGACAGGASDGKDVFEAADASFGCKIVVGAATGGGTFGEVSVVFGDLSDDRAGALRDPESDHHAKNTAPTTPATTPIHLPAV